MNGMGDSFMVQPLDRPVSSNLTLMVVGNARRTMGTHVAVPGNHVLQGLTRVEFTAHDSDGLRTTMFPISPYRIERPLYSDHFHNNANQTATQQDGIGEQRQSHTRYPGGWFFHVLQGIKLAPNNEQQAGNPDPAGTHI